MATILTQKNSYFIEYPNSRKLAKKTGAKHYFTGKECPNGHLDLRATSSCCCLSCAREWAARERKNNPAYLESQREICRENNKRRYREDSDFREKSINSSKERERKMYAESQEFRDKRREYSRNIYKNNAEFREKRKAWQREYRDKRKNTPEFKAKEAWRTLVKRCVKAGMKKDHPTKLSLGYSPKELRLHLESLWLDGMSWENYGEWHIDHIRPISSFPINSKPSEVNCLSNLQPLWAFDNISKGCK